MEGASGNNQDTGGAAPPRTLGFWAIWALGVGAVVGDGIFLLLGQGIE